jgi:hypothetical protein
MNICSVDPLTHSSHWRIRHCICTLQVSASLKRQLERKPVLLVEDTVTFYRQRQVVHCRQSLRVLFDCFRATDCSISHLANLTLNITACYMGTESKTTFQLLCGSAQMIWLPTRLWFIHSMVRKNAQFVKIARQYNKPEHHNTRYMKAFQR